MKDTLQKIIVGTVVIIGVGSTPIIPSEMKLEYSFQVPCDVKTEIFETASGTVQFEPEYIPTCDSGVQSVSVFRDEKGNKVFVPLDNQTYEKMGEQGGAIFNPKKDEYRSIFESLVPSEAKAAIAFDAATNAWTNSATSLTYAHTVSGSDRLLWVYSMNNSARTISSITYNGVATTNYVADALGQKSQLWYLIAPSTGTNNVVITVGGAASFIYSTAVSYTGVAQTSPTDGSDTSSGSGTSLTSTITTTADNAWTILGARNDSTGDTAASTGATDRLDVAGIIQVYDSNGPITPAGSYSMSTTQAAGGTTGHVMAAFKPSAGATPRRIINIQ